MADVPSKYKRAFLQLHEPRDKGKKMGPVLDTINFSFNPKELTVQRSADWKATSTKKPQPPEYNGAKAGTVSVEMFLDASEGGQVKIARTDGTKWTVRAASGPTGNVVSTAMVGDAVYVVAGPDDNHLALWRADAAALSR